MSALTNFTNIIGSGGSFNGTSSPVGGITGSFGNPAFLGLAAIIIMLIIGMKLKVSIDLIILSIITMIQIIAGVYFPEWIFWIFIIGGGGIFGLGLLKVLKNR